MLASVTVILLGLSGAGKTFLGNVLSSLGFHLIDTSIELTRRALEWEDEDGVALRYWLDHGRANNAMAPNKAVDRAIAAAIAEVPLEQSIVISGYPRTVEQANALAMLLEQSGRNKRGAIAVTIEVSPGEALQRALNGDPSRAARADSTPEKVMERHQMFTASNNSICVALGRHGINTSAIDGNPSKIEVAIGLLREVFDLQVRGQRVDYLQRVNTH